MKLVRRKHGSQRASAPIKLELHPPAHDSTELVFRDEDGNWLKTPEMQARVDTLAMAIYPRNHDQDLRKVVAAAMSSLVDEIIAVARLERRGK